MIPAKSTSDHRTYSSMTNGLAGMLRWNVDSYRAVRKSRSKRMLFEGLSPLEKLRRANPPRKERPAPTDVSGESEKLVLPTSAKTTGVITPLLPNARSNCPDQTDRPARVP